MNMQSRWVWLERGMIGRARLVDRVGDRSAEGHKESGGGVQYADLVAVFKVFCTYIRVLVDSVDLPIYSVLIPRH